MALITTRALTKTYGSVVALDDLDLALEPGVIGLVGANGAGKSTLIKILLGLLAPTSGTAAMFDLDVATSGLEIRRLIGYMPEHDCLPLEINATEFVTHMAQVNGLPRGAARERTAETLRHVGLFEERYREMRGYSTGMRQRVKLAQALVHDPQLMLLDEPTNGLDPAGRDEMLDLVRRIGTEFGISILMSSHLLSEIERVCEYLVVDRGRAARPLRLARDVHRTTPRPSRSRSTGQSPVSPRTCASGDTSRTKAAHTLELELDDDARVRRDPRRRRFPRASASCASNGGGTTSRICSATRSRVGV